jgi:hypothetical protein
MSAASAQPDEYPYRRVESCPAFPMARIELFLTHKVLNHLASASCPNLVVTCGFTAKQSMSPCRGPGWGPARGGERLNHYGDRKSRTTVHDWPAPDDEAQLHNLLHSPTLYGASAIRRV